MVTSASGFAGGAYTVCQKTIRLSITEGKKVCKGTVRVPFRVQSPAAAVKIVQ